MKRFVAPAASSSSGSAAQPAREAAQPVKALRSITDVQRWLKNNNATGTLTSRKKMPDETWLCYWNADLMVELHHILQPLNDVIRGAGGKKSKGRKAKGKKEK